MNTIDLRPAVEQWLKKLKIEEEKADNTIKQYSRSLDKFIEFIESNEIKQINKKTVLDYKNNMLEEMRRNQKNPQKGRTQLRSIKTVNLRLIALNKFLKENGHPELTVKTEEETVSNVLDNMLTEKEYQRILKWADKLGKEKTKLIIETLTGTGIRISELEAITVESLKKRTAIVTNKGNTRTIFIPKQLTKKLKAYCKKHNITEGIIFHGKDKTKMINQSYLRQDIKKIAGKARGIRKDKIHPHIFRHVFSKRYANMPNPNPYMLPILLGHSTKTLPVTFKYTIPTSEECLEAVDQMEAYYSDTGKGKKK